ncbi:MAG TPA: 2-amino-4-hydroxy-6-hydroxymethyldihydropteridine diphosphokinase [Anaerolineae bacterium]|nr:2-amino-4-hydroxy-6-hydroxymethyldihydropteridine diphosphokinase [Anaerolineae bacterium]
MNDILLSMGSNLGNRYENLQTAVSELQGFSKIIRRSSIYDTVPWGYLDQPHFLNQAIAIQTKLKPLELLIQLKGIEKKIGRQNTFRYGPRILDIDILFFNDLIKKTPELTIPHPSLHERAFVLIPLVEIAPDFYHPVFKKTVRELCGSISNEGVTLYRQGKTLNNNWKMR